MVKNAIKKIPSFLLSPLSLFIFSQYFLYCSFSGFSSRPWYAPGYSTSTLFSVRALLLAGRRGIFQFTRVHRRCGSSTRFRSLATSLMSVAVLRHGDELAGEKNIRSLALLHNSVLSIDTLLWRERQFHRSPSFPRSFSFSILVLLLLLRRSEFYL